MILYRGGAGTSTEMIFLDAGYFFHWRFIRADVSSVKYVGPGSTTVSRDLFL